MVWTGGRKAVGAVVAAGVLIVTGCSAQGPVEASEPKDVASASAPPSPTPSSSPAPARPLTARQLKSLLLREGEVPRIDSAPVQGPVPKYEPRVLVPGPGCQDVFDALVSHNASTSVIQDFWWKNNQWGGRTWLASYSGDGAAEEFQRLTEGLKTCEKLVGRTPEGKLNSRIDVAKAPALGDEAVAFDLSAAGPDGTVQSDHHIWVRVGGLTVEFSDRGAQRTPGFPLDAVADRQLDRLP
ncbi:hypothetical protein [Streptomyces sp. NPDC054866]